MKSAIGKIKLALLAALAIVVYGCRRDKPCHDNPLSIMFVPYDSSAVTTFRQVKLPKVSSPGSLTDTLTVADNKTSHRIYREI